MDRFDSLPVAAGPTAVLEARSWGQRRAPLVAIVAFLALVLLAVPAGGTTDAARPLSIIVRAVPGGIAAAERAVLRLGGRVGRQLPIIDGFSARVPETALADLGATPAVFSTTVDARLQPMATSYTTTTTASTYDALNDVGSMYNTTLMTGAQQYWKAGYTGKDVDVAVIDSGVAPVDGLTAAGKVVNGPDLSFESQATNLQYLDTYGHGTHMSGIIAGASNAAATSRAYVGNASEFVGMAPEARIVSVKVADAHGATDVSQVIAAIDWVVQHRRDNGMNIRVLNLSYGTDSSQSYLVDPLAFAAEQAWKAGIVVVAAAGNAGFAKGGSMTNPAYDPFVLAVGAADTSGTTNVADDVPASFSANGPTGTTTTTGARLVDLLAPGTHVVSLRDPGSYIDQTYGSTGAVSPTFFRGSGTSQAAAVMSGAAALVLQKNPALTPDQVKKMLTQTATRLSSASSQTQGAGELNLAAALTASPVAYSNKSTASSGTGTLEGSRGSGHLVKDGVTLSGEKDIMGSPFDASSMARLEAAGKSWSGGTWNGKSWSGSDWLGKSWSGASWSGKSWSGSDWSGKSWSSTTWSGASWSGKSWSNASWTGNSWLEATWANNVWAGSRWS